MLAAAGQRRVIFIASNCVKLEAASPVDRCPARQSLGFGWPSSYDDGRLSSHPRAISAALRHRAPKASAWCASRRRACPAFATRIALLSRVWYDDTHPPTSSEAGSLDNTAKVQTTPSSGPMLLLLLLSEQKGSALRQRCFFPRKIRKTWKKTKKKTGASVGKCRRDIPVWL